MWSSVASFDLFAEVSSDLLLRVFRRSVVGDDVQWEVFVVGDGERGRGACKVDE